MVQGWWCISIFEDIFNQVHIPKVQNTCVHISLVHYTWVHLTAHSIASTAVSVSDAWKQNILHLWLKLSNVIDLCFSFAKMRKQAAAHLRCPLCCVGQEICWKLFTWVGWDFLFNPKFVNILNLRSGIKKQSLAWSSVCELYIYEGALHQRAAEERGNDVTSG